MNLYEYIGLNDSFEEKCFRAYFFSFFWALHKYFTVMAYWETCNTIDGVGCWLVSTNEWWKFVRWFDAKKKFSIISVFLMKVHTAHHRKTCFIEVYGESYDSHE